MNDIVLLKEQHVKRSNIPMGIVIKTIENDIGEVTNVLIKKGKTGETVKRHVESLIPVLHDEKCEYNPVVNEDNNIVSSAEQSELRQRPMRKAAHKGATLTRDLMSRSLV